MKKTALISIFILLIVSGWGCENDKAEPVSYSDLNDGKVDNGAKVSYTGKVAYSFKANNDNSEIDVEGPTQFIKLVDENSKGIDVYNETDVTGEKVKADEEITIEGVFYDKKKSDFFIIQATEIN